VEITNRTIAILISVTLVLVLCAVWFTFDPRPAEVVTSTYFRPDPQPEKPPAVIPLVKRAGKGEFTPKGSLEIRSKAGAQADTATLLCGDVEFPLFRAQQKLKRNQAYFAELSSDGCTVILQKTLDASEGEYEAFKPGYGPVYPGDKVTCTVRDARTWCEGGVAHKRSGSVTIRAAVPASISVDGEDLGTLPVENRKMRMGKHQLKITYGSGRESEWPLNIGADEAIQVFFPEPKGASTTALPN